MLLPEIIAPHIRADASPAGHATSAISPNATKKNKNFTKQPRVASEQITLINNLLHHLYEPEVFRRK